MNDSGDDDHINASWTHDYHARTRWDLGNLKEGKLQRACLFFSRMDAQQVKSGLDAGSSWGKTGCQMYKETEHGWLEYYFPIDGEAYFQGLR